MKAWIAGLILALSGAMVTTTDTVAQETAEKSAKKNVVDVMFVHDTHSHLNSFETVEDGQAQTLGGFARIKTLIQEQQEKNPDTLLLDAGDFSMGTLIQTVYEEEASELRMLGALGFDVTTLGNHEFDYRSEGLSNMLIRAASCEEQVPELVLCNVDWAEMEKAGLTKDQQMIRDAFEQYGVRDYVMMEKNGVRIAVTGVFGEDSLACAPTCVLEFENPVKAVKETVAEIQKNEDADMIVCVSHSGTAQDASKSEDEILAKEVPELDLIISGHSHTKLDTPIVCRDTYVVSAGEYGKYLGSLSMSQKEDGRWSMDAYDLIPVDDSIEPDEGTQKKVDELMSAVDRGYLNQFGYTKDQVLCTNEIPFASVDDVYEQHTELNLGSIMADAYTYAAEQITGDPHPVDVAVVPSGTIRDTYVEGDVTVEDVFQSFSLGIGEDMVPGYPLISVYLTGAELKTAAEIDASVSDLMGAARLYTDGLCWSYHPRRMILNKVTDVWLCDRDGQRVELEDDTLYRVVTDYYSSQMLGSVTDVSYGLLSIVPKFADGTPITNFADAILMDGDQELKAWVAIARYMESFADTDGDGVGNIPSEYSTLQGRKIVETGGSVLDLVKCPNKFFFLIIGIALIAVLLVVLVIVLAVKLIRNYIRKV